MRRWALAAMMVPLAAAGPLTAEQNRSRPLVLVAPSPDDPAAVDLANALAQPQTAAALAERQVVVFTVLAGQGARAGVPLDRSQTAALLAGLGLPADGPATLLLIGKDGGVKLRQPRLAVPELLATIDGMPMRRREAAGR